MAVDARIQGGIARILVKSAYSVDQSPTSREVERVKRAKALCFCSLVTAASAYRIAHSVARSAGGVAKGAAQATWRRIKGKKPVQAEAKMASSQSFHTGS